MAKKKSKKKPWGRSYGEISKDYDALHGASHDVPLGNTDPTVVHGKLWGGMPNRSRAARGGLKRQRGKYT